MWYLLLFLCTWGVAILARRLALAKGLMDVPNDRSSHQIPTPRGGGISFVLVFSLSSLYLLLLTPDHQALTTILFGAISISALSFTDDWLSLSAKIRLLGQGLISAICISLVFVHAASTAPPDFLWPLPVLGVVWFLNLYNFMDGTDGLAGVEAISILLPMALLFSTANETVPAFLCFGLSASIAGFLLLNLPKAKLFMGDVGSTFLGFFIAMMALYTALFSEISFWYWVLLSTCFWLDASVTLFRRILNKEPVTQAHKTHAYQRMHQSGWSHGQLLIGLLSINSFLAGLAMLAFLHFLSPQGAVVLGLIIGLAILGAIEKKQPRIIRT